MCEPSTNSCTYSCPVWHTGQYLRRRSLQSMVSLGEVIAVRTLRNTHDYWHVYPFIQSRQSRAKSILKADNHLASVQGGVTRCCSTLWCRKQSNYKNMCNHVNILCAWTLPNMAFTNVSHDIIISQCSTSTNCLFSVDGSVKTRLWFVASHLTAYTHICLYCIYSVYPQDTFLKQILTMKSQFCGYAC